MKKCDVFGSGLMTHKIDNVPGWPGNVAWVREMNGRRRCVWDQLVAKHNAAVDILSKRPNADVELPDLGAAMVALCVVEDDHEQAAYMFEYPEDLPMIAEHLNAKTIARIAEACAAFSALDFESIEEDKAELKNG